MITEKEYLEAKSTIKKYNKQLKQADVSGSLPTIEELKPFLYWVFHEADRIYVEHTLGWRDEAIKEMYEAYNRSPKIKRQ